MRACEVAQAALFAAAQKAEISGLQARVEAAEHAGSSANSEPPAANLKCRNGSFACALNWTKRPCSSIAAHEWHAADL